MSECHICGKTLHGDPCPGCARPYRAGLLKAARMASARAGRFKRLADSSTGSSREAFISARNVILAIADDLRKLARGDP